MKIGIITELDSTSMNYGNVLQAFALTNYLNNIDGFTSEVLIVNHLIYKKITSYKPKIISKKFLRMLKKFFVSKEKNKFDFNKRLENFKNFTLNIRTRYITSIDEITSIEYDCIIVGSDIVWVQDYGVVNRLKFLDFKTNKKLSYAASFGSNFIPKENVNFIKKCLLDFSAISVRESNSVQLLSDIGINNAEYVCDPTLLLNKSEWNSLEKKPVVDTSDEYIFAYLLGKDFETRKKIKQIACDMGLKIVTVPHSNGVYSNCDDGFADVNVNECSPENWIYLIHNAKYVFTDSFHGTVFSTIFEKKFIVVKRKNEININNRMTDYLANIGQNDKFVDITKNNDFDKMSWNYDEINKKLETIIGNSKKYLERALDLDLM